MLQDSRNFLQFQQPPPPPVFDLMSEEGESRDRLACAKCDSEKDVSNRPFKRTFVPSVAYAALLLAPVIGILLIAILRVNHSITLPFCQRCSKMQKRGKLLRIFGVLSALAACVAGFYLMLAVNNPFALFIPFVIPVALLIFAEIDLRSGQPEFRETSKERVVVNAGRYGEIVFSKGSIATPV